MAKPVIITVDDEPVVLNAIERDLRRHFGQDYRVVKASSGEEALAAVRQLQQRNDLVALFLADQRMPGMTGVEFIAEAMRLYPEARRVLLTAYADTEVAIASINSIGLDYYLVKPWSPPEQRLYPVLDDLLGEWHSRVVLPFEGIRVIGSQWSPSSHRIKDFLARNQVPYQWLDVERDAQARALVEGLPDAAGRLPVVLFPDGSHLVEPDNPALAERAGLKTSAEEPFYQLVIIGAGPAGLGAAVYASSEGLRTVLLEREGPGGQAGGSASIENLLGFPRGLSGADLARRAVTQAKRFGAEILTAVEVVGLRREDPYRIVELSNGAELTAHAVLISTGVDTRKLDVPGAEQHMGAGVYYGAAVTEAAACRGRRVFIIGGGNSAGQGAMFLSRFASRVTMVSRSSSLEKTMSQYLIDRIHSAENIDVVVQAEVAAIGGEQGVENLTVRHRDRDEEETLPGEAVFIFIGATPRTQFLGDMIARDSAGFVLTGPGLLEDGKRPSGWNLKRDPYLLETSIPGVFAAGDVRHGSVKRVASAIGEGSATLASIHQYLSTV